ncbi:I-type lysozyme [Gryllus bimaculatus]|nr:I-type lysozyme [Gryllus bimaculatus]
MATSARADVLARRALFSALILAAVVAAAAGEDPYADCAQVYKCASLIVTQYMNKLAKDCNGDGRVNCDDFAMSHHNGGYSCHLPLNRTAAGQKYLERYLKCRGKDEDDDPLGLAVAAS